MSDKKVLVTSRGVYAVDKDGKTVELEQGSETTLEQKQAENLVKRGRVELVNNTSTKQSGKDSK